MLENIIKFVPEGSLRQRFHAIGTIAGLNRRFNAVTKSGKILNQRKEVHGLSTLGRQNPRLRGQNDFLYALRLVGVQAGLTPEQAVLATGGPPDPDIFDLEHELSKHLKFQPLEVQSRIATLDSQTPIRRYEAQFDYMRRLKGIYPDLTAEDAVLIAYRYTSLSLKSEVSALLEFQPPDVQARIATIRSLMPQEPVKDPIRYLRENYPQLTDDDVYLAATGSLDSRVEYDPLND